MKHLDQLCRGAFFFATLPPGLRCRFADNEATSPQDYKWLTPLASLSLRRRSSFELRAMSFEPASQTTRLQDYKWLTHDFLRSRKNFRVFRNFRIIFAIK